MRRLRASDSAEVEVFLGVADLTLAGLDAPGLHLWVERDAEGGVCGSTGFELSRDRRHALVRSVAVAPGLRGSGVGSQLARFAMAQAAGAGASRAWLFSRRSGAFWQQLGFELTTTELLTGALGETHQVRLFTRTGQLDREVAWARSLAHL
ncbi:acetyltransferase (GNAT) family protein [Nocardioides aurantiacus]|uniref:Acetyltransferase (GNAT) family protein n=1 Tax=Nocardioides aurantiacus TaxID=86796 RepID=A0A3N2CUF5_9ACTN|nr:acetyltransferase (GNAT) family protein [Nocardioides aurantiacus]